MREPDKERKGSHLPGRKFPHGKLDLRQAEKANGRKRKKDTVKMAQK